MKTITLTGKGKFRFILFATILIVGSIFVRDGYGQIWPVNFDGAPVLVPGQMETSLFFAASYALSEGKSATFGYLPGIKIGFGIARYFDLKLSYSRGFYTFFSDGKWTDSKENNITIIPKVSFLKGAFGIKFPITFILYNDEYANKVKAHYLMGPRFIISLHYKQYVEFNISPFFEFYIPGTGDSPSYFVGGNLGFAFSSNLKRWSVRPEGFLNYPIPGVGSNDHLIILGWGLAATFNFDVFTKKKEPAQK